MTNRYTLVIIDMQWEFRGTAERALGGVIKAIRNAKKNCSSIMVVEYANSGHTLGEVAQVLKNYPKVYTVRKSSDDGSAEVKHALLKHKLSKNLRVCGVNLNCCVAETVDGLLNFCRVTVLKNAVCASDWETNRHLLNFTKHRLEHLRIGALRLAIAS